jgi:hypothetical protein
MKIDRVDDTIIECKKHLLQFDAFGTEIEAYLTRYLLVLISSCFEEELEKIFIERANSTNDPFVIQYFTSEIPQKLKSVGITKLSEFIAKFGNKYKEKFKEEISMTREATLYGNLIKNRHLVAHETQAPAMTFTEVVSSYEESNIIIDKIKQIIYT